MCTNVLFVGDCDSKYMKGRSDWCYRLHTEMLGFWEAEKRCQEDGDHLISFTDLLELIPVSTFLR